MAGGARDGFVPVQGLLRLPDHGELLLRHRAEILHGAEIVLHLRIAAHARENGDDIADACREPERPPGVGESAVRAVENGLHRVDRLRKNASLHGFHNGDGDPPFLADLPVPARRHPGILPVRVIQLELDEFRVRMRVEKRLEQIRIGVEREAPVPDPARLLELLHIIPDAVLVVFPVGAALDRVEQVEIEVSRSGPLEALVELPLRALLVVTSRRGGVELGRDRVAVPWNPFGQRFPHRLLRSPAVVDVRGVEVSPSGLQKRVGHADGLFDVDAPVRVLRQAHQPEPELEKILPEIVRHFISPFQIRIFKHRGCRDPRLSAFIIPIPRGDVKGELVPDRQTAEADSQILF